MSVLKVVGKTVGRDCKFLDSETGEEIACFKGTVESVKWLQDRGVGKLVVTFIHFQVESKSLPLKPGVVTGVARELIESEEAS